MLQRNKYLAVLVTAVLLIADAAYAGDTPSEINQRVGVGDPLAGKEKSALCQGCHGEDGNSAASAFPKLSGQWSDYIQKQVREFQNGARFNETMTDVAMSVDDFKDLFDISAYFASQKTMGGTPIANEEEQKLYLEGQKLFLEGNERTGAFRCVKCHGEYGKGQPLNNNLFPVIGGQHKEYLIKQLTDFKMEDRENDRSGMMLRITTKLTDHDIEALATYLSREPVPPSVPETVSAAPQPVVAPESVAAVPVASAAVSEILQTLLDAKPLHIQDTNFEIGSAKLKPKVFKILDEVVKFAGQKPEAKLALTGYTDTTGSARTNQKLSVARAESVKKYLVKNGVSADRITTKGEGPANPVADNNTKEGRAKNRRVDIQSVISEEKKT
jgi:outer membrane protein OmpA-like peptidoglycan-associated protein